MRSPEEIRFRVRQEAANLAMLARPPRPPGPPVAVGLLPDPPRVAASLGGTAYAREVEALADGVMNHRFPLLGLTIDTGPEIEWQRDYLHGISTGTPYFRRVPYLDFARVGDHKTIWELNRHQHLVLLAQAFLLTGRREFLNEAFLQLESWMEANPFLRGINWASALEVAFRSLSWMWLSTMAGAEMPGPVRRRFLTELYRHGCYLERNLSIYFSPNTHLLGEAVALHALGTLFSHAGWTDAGGRIVLEAMERQVRPDGSHFEQSAYYHVYALDFFLLHRVLANPPEPYTARLRRMAEYLHALMGPSGVLPYLGDDDGGRVFHPYGDRPRFGRGTLATCAALFAQPQWLFASEDLACQAAWWLGEQALALTPAPAAPSSKLFADAGVAVMISGDRQVVMKAGPFGEGSGGHSHSDALSLVARIGSREVLIDPGTYTYVADPQERDRFRGSAAHNTVRIDGRDQAVPAGPFRWHDPPHTTIHQWTTSEEADSLDASCEYGGFTHRRRVRFLKPYTVLVLDTVTGPPGVHSIEQFWHLGAPEDASRIGFSGVAETLEGCRSRSFGVKEAATVLRVTYRGPLPARLGAVLDLSDEPAPDVDRLERYLGEV